jgi:hypothetical protein
MLVGGSSSLRSENPPVRKSSDRDSKPALELSVAQWKQLDPTVDNGLAFLATQQEVDGSFPTLPHAKPGVTGLCVLAFLSRGHLPNEGPYGRHVQRGIEFVLSQQRTDGLLTIQQVEPTLVSHGVSHAGSYNHGIAGLMLSEVYSAYYCSQAMFQLGGEHWSRFYPPLMSTLARNQRPDGSWNREGSGDTTRYGNAYSSALAILALTPPYQLLPIYQR